MKDIELIGGKAFDEDAFAKSLEYVPPTTEKKIKVVTDKGEVDRLTKYQENSLYARARVLKEQIRQSLLSMSQLHMATPDNIQRHLKTESTPEHTKRVEEFRNIMKAINADPDDISIEKMRKE